MDAGSQRGSTLAETAVAVAIVSLAAAAILGAVVAATRASGGDPVRQALQDAVQRELHVALDVLKYRDATVEPATVATTLPMPTGSPLAAQLSLTTSTTSDGTLKITIQATALADAGERAVLNARLTYRAPLPGSQIAVPGLLPAPTGAP